MARLLGPSASLKGCGERDREKGTQRTEGQQDSKEKTKITDKKNGRKEDSWKEGRTQGGMEGE